MNSRTFALPLIMLFTSGIAVFGDSYESFHEAFFEQHRALAEERMEIHHAYPNGNSPEHRQAMEKWREENWERIEAMREMATELGRLNAERDSSPEAIDLRMASLQEMEVPENLPPAQEAFLTKRRQLMFDKLEFERSLTDLPLAARRQALERWRESVAGRFEELHQLGRDAAREQELTVDREYLEPPPIPDGVTEDVRRFLAARNALIAERNAIGAVHRDPESRETAIQNWREENRERIEEMHRLAARTAR